MTNQNKKFSSCSFNDFNSIRELYRSSAGAVYCAKFRYDNKKYVLKERTLPELGRRKDIMNEVNLLSQLNHPNVVRCEGFFRDEGRNSLFIVLEYCQGGDLKALLDGQSRSNGNRKEYFDEKTIWHIFVQLCDGLKHLHEHGIVHRDLKTMNIMVINTKKHKHRYDVKIADLGVSRQLSEDTMMLQTFYGTPLYLSPELVENKQYNEKTDLWSLGVILYELATLSHPFKSKTLLGLAKLVTAGKYEDIDNFGGSSKGPYSKGLSRCIKWLLNVNYLDRPNIMQLLTYAQDQASKFGSQQLHHVGHHHHREKGLKSGNNGNANCGDLNEGNKVSTLSIDVDDQNKAYEGDKAAPGTADTAGTEYASPAFGGNGKKAMNLAGTAPRTVPRKGRQGLEPPRMEGDDSPEPLRKHQEQAQEIAFSKAQKKTREHIQPGLLMTTPLSFRQI